VNNIDKQNIYNYEVKKVGYLIPASWPKEPINHPKMANEKDPATHPCRKIKKLVVIPASIETSWNSAKTLGIE
jgi:hypothetical protein